MKCSSCGRLTANLTHSGNTTAEVLYSARIQPTIGAGNLGNRLNQQKGIWDAEPDYEDGEYHFWHMVEVPAGEDPMDFVESKLRGAFPRKDIEITYVEDVNIQDHGELALEFDYVLSSPKGRFVTDEQASDVAKSLSGVLGDQYGGPDVDVQLKYRGEREAGGKRMHADHDVPVLTGYAEMRATEGMSRGRPQKDAVVELVNNVLFDYLRSRFNGLAGSVFPI